MSDLVRNESYIGKKYNFVGTKATDLILETIGKVYVKQQNKMTLLDDFIKQIVNKGSNNKSSIMILGPDQSLPLSEYPGDGVIIYDPTTQVLYITYEDDYMMLVNTGGKEIYVKLIGDTMTGQLNIELEDVNKPPFVVNSQALVENLNAQYLNGHTADEFLTSNSSATIAGDWNFNKTLSLSNGLKSKTYQSGCSGIGFYVGSNGDATFNNITVRGKINECNPDTSEEIENEVQPEYITGGYDGSYIASQVFYIPSDTTIEVVSLKYDEENPNENDRYSYPVTFIENQASTQETQYLYKEGVDNSSEDSISYFNLFSDNFKLGLDDEDKYRSTILATIFNGNYVKLTFSDLLPKYLLDTQFVVGSIYQYWKYTDVEKTSAEYYNMILTNIITSEDGTTSYIFLMSNRNLLRNWDFTRDCNGVISYSASQIPYFMQMNTQEEVDNWDEESENEPYPCTILDQPRVGNCLRKYSNFTEVANTDIIELVSNGTYQPGLIWRDYPSISTNFVMSDDINKYENEDGVYFQMCKRRPINLKEGDFTWNGWNNYAVYARELLTENLIAKSSSTENLPEEPEGAGYTYDQQGYRIEKGAITHYRRGIGNDCGVGYNYFNGGVQLTDSGQINFIGDTELLPPYTDSMLDYHNQLIENNEQVKKIPNIEATLNQLVEQMTQVNTNITNINNSINDLNDRIDNIESGTGGDLTKLTERVNDLHSDVVDLMNITNINRSSYTSGVQGQNDYSSEYTIKFGNGLKLKYGWLPYCKNEETNTFTFEEPFSTIYFVVVQSMRTSSGYRSYNFISTHTINGFKYMLDDCTGLYVAMGT